MWALDPDGWSEYRGLSAGVEHVSEALELFGSYTWSETTDNWVGAAFGLPDAELRPGLATGDEWSEGTSDYDVPHRLVAGVAIRAGPATVAGTYTFRSGYPFTPRYRPGVDANGDGSGRNDVAFVPGDARLTTVLEEWPCLESQANRFAIRNSCRSADRHGVAARLTVRLAALRGMDATIVIDALDLVEDSGGFLDEALLLVDPSGSIVTSTDDSTVTLPLTVNPDFGDVLLSGSRGRMLRLGIRIGG